MKKILTFITNLVLAWCILSNGIVYAGTENIFASEQLKIGDYFVLGKYNDEPIVWRYVAEDENGKLMVSDKILCYKHFGSYYSDQGIYENPSSWKDSYIREWLNSNVSSNEADWSSVISKRDVEHHNMDINEKGFLHEDNFSLVEKSVLKPVSQWTMLSKFQTNLSENGIDTVYSGIKIHIPGNPRDGGKTEFYNISELPEHYYGAAQQTTDTMFLLDEMQIYNMRENLGDISAMWGKEFDYISFYPCYDYSLRTPTEETVCIIAGKMEPSNNPTYTGQIDDYTGIRPAFYLNDDSAVILTGSGTEEDPYVINGKTEDSVDSDNSNNAEETPNGISVFYNGSEISFDQSPFTENDRVLVPMRAIFEAFGAEVKWDGDTEMVIAKDGSNTITMQIGNNIIFKNTKEIESDVAPRIVKDRTFVPLRVIAESFEANVDWNEKLNRVVITKLFFTKK